MYRNSIVNSVNLGKVSMVAADREDMPTENDSRAFTSGGIRGGYSTGGDDGTLGAKFKVKLMYRYNVMSVCHEICVAVE